MQRGNVWAATVAAVCLAGLGSSVWLATDQGAADRPSNATSRLAEPRLRRAANASAPSAPLAFEPATGRTRVAETFVARRSRHQVAVGSSGVVLTLLGESGSEPAGRPGARRPAPPTASVVRLRFDGARPAVPGRGLDALSAVTNYYVSADRARWRSGVPQYGRVQYDEVYPGIDLVFHSRHHELEYDFVVAPGADPDGITFSLSGVDGVEVAADGDLVLDTPAGELRHRAPVAYQEQGGRRVPVAARYERVDEDTVRFRLGDYDRSRPLTIDPILEYGTYLGGSGTDDVYGVAFDGGGNVYVAGYEWSNDFPLAGGPTAGGFDAFVSKFSDTGELQWTTVYGSTAFDFAYAIAVNLATDAIYVAGSTSGNVPTTPGAWDTQRTGDDDLFVLRLGDGGELDAATLLGGADVRVFSNYWERALGVAVTPAGVAVSGETSAADFPTTTNGFDRTFNGGDIDAVVAVLSADLSTLTYATFLGGGGVDSAAAVAVRPGSDTLHVTGHTGSTDFPVSTGAFDTTSNGYIDAFVAAVQPGAGQLVYSTYLGGDAYDSGNDIAVDATGQATVGGSVQSNVFPTTPGAADTTRSGLDDGFVARVTADGSALVYSTLVGGTNGPWQETVARIGLDGSGAVYAVGQTDAPDLPVSPGAHTRSRIGGNLDGFVAKIAPNGSAIVYASYWGTPYDWDPIRTVAVDRLGTVHMAGRVSAPVASTALPVTSSAHDRTGNGDDDAFLARLAPGLNGHLRFPNVTPLAIPPASTLDSAVTISGVSGEIESVTVSLRATHTFTADYNFWLVGPNGTTVELSSGNGGSSGFGYGTSCAPEGDRTIFDDTASTSIAGAAAPFVGTYRPEQPLSAFAGLSGNALNGVWLLRAQDMVTADTGTVLCWTLNIKLRQPGIASVSPMTGNNGTAITISGTNLIGQALVVPTVRVGGVPINLITWSNTTITGTLGSRFAGPADVVVSDTHHRSGVLLDGFTYVSTQPLTLTRAGAGAGTVTSSPVGILCGTDCTEAYGPNAVVTLTATPAAGSSFSGWSGGGCTGTGTCVVTMTQARSVTATFAIVQHPLSITRAGTGAGTVTSNPAGITCGADCAESYNHNTQVTLTATPATGSSFSGWSGEGCTGTGTCVVTMTQAGSVTATFANVQHPLSITRAGTGTGTVTSNPPGITCGTDCVESYPFNTSVTLTATAAAGSTFGGWGGACTGTATCVVTMSAARNVTATFTPSQGGPTIETRSPARGSTRGGTVVSLTGTNFLADTIVRVGTTAVPVLLRGTTDLSVVTPPAAAGMQTITVQTSAGQATTSFEYAEPTTDTRSGWRRPSFASSRYTAFESALALLPDDTNGVTDIYVHDDATDSLRRASVSTTWRQASGGESTRAAISPSGRFVAFESLATNLVPGDTNALPDIFLHDRDSDEDGVFDELGGVATTRVSVSSAGVQATGGASTLASISGTGRWIAFQSGANNLAPNDDNPAADVFVHDRLLARTERVSVRTDGPGTATGASLRPVISQSGRFVSFDSAAGLVFTDTNDRRDVYVHDRDLDTDGVMDEPGAVATRRVSVSSSGEQTTDGDSVDPTITGEGRYIAFASWATTLVAGDTNGVTDVFLHDRDVDADGVFDEAGQIATRRLSAAADGSQLLVPSGVPRISANGALLVLLVSDLSAAEPVTVARPGEIALGSASNPSGKTETGTIPNPTAPEPPPPVLPPPDPTSNVDEEDPAVNPDGTTWGGTVVPDPSTPGGPSVEIHEEPENLPTPWISGITPARGPESGGTLVTIDGSDLAGTLLWQGTPIAPVATSATRWTVLAPARGGLPVAVGLRFRRDDRLSNQATFTYVPVLSTPRYTGHAPGSGPVNGGTSVTIAGTGFLTPTVRLGRLPAVVTGWTPTSITVTTPEVFEAGPVPLVVTNADGAETFSTEPFTYVNAIGQAAQVTRVEPESGPMTGGTAVTVFGAGFGPGTSVYFDGVSAPSVQVASSSTLIVETPPGPPRAVTLTVVVPGQSTVSIPFAYRTVAQVTTCGGDDLDQDTMGDEWETQYGLTPGDGSDGGADPDNDGRTNAQECVALTHPRGLYTRYLAEGATGSLFDTRIVVANPNSTAAVVLFRYQSGSGLTPSRVLVVPPMSRRFVIPASIPELAAADFSTVIESDVEVIVDRSMFWREPSVGIYGSHAESSLAAPGTRWYLAEGATHGAFTLFYLLQNPGTIDAVVNVRYLRQNGPPIERDYVVPAQRRVNIQVDLVPGLEAADVSAVFTSTNQVPIIVERAMYRTADSPRPFESGHNSAAISAPSTRWFLAEGATGSFFDTFILLANPNDTPADLEIRYLLQDGRTITRTRQVAGNRRETIWVAGEDPALAATSVSTIVTSTNGVPIIVERAMWWPGIQATLANPGMIFWGEAHNSPGATTTGVKWAVADGETGPSPVNTRTFILVANTAAYAADVDVTLLSETDQPPITRRITVAPNSRFTVDVAGRFPETFQQGSRGYSVVVESLPTGGQPPAPIVVERAMYSDAAGLFWAAGTNLLATRLR